MNTIFFTTLMFKSVVNIMNKFTLQRNSKREASYSLPSVY